MISPVFKRPQLVIQWGFELTASCSADWHQLSTQLTRQGEAQLKLCLTLRLMQLAPQLSHYQASTTCHKLRCTNLFSLSYETNQLNLSLDLCSH